jgi:hypothetical protein
VKLFVPMHDSESLLDSRLRGETFATFARDLEKTVLHVRMMRLPYFLPGLTVAVEH